MQVLCLDGPLAGVQTTVETGQTEIRLYQPDGTEVLYRIDGLVTVFPGSLYAARVVSD